MLYAVQYIDALIVVAADTLLDFEHYANDPKDGDNYTAERADILEMLGNPRLKGYTLNPVIITTDDPTGVAEALSLTILRPVAGVDQQAAMLERARLEEEATKPIDRRTLAEVHGLVDNDPWDNSTEEQKAAAAKQDAHMRSVREAGGLTGDSFDNKVGDKLSVHRAKVTLDGDNEVAGVDVLASKNSIKPYEITVDGEAVAWTEIWDEHKIPENRIIIAEDNRAVIQLHDFEQAQIAETLDKRNLNYTISRVDSGVVADDTEFTVDGHESVVVFFSVQIEEASVHEIVPAVGATGFDVDLITTMRNVGRGCWLAFVNEVNAKDCADKVREIGHACAVVPINRKGQSIISGDAGDVRVVDTNQHVSIGPRPWNDRADEITKMSDAEKEELYKSIKGEEYLIATDVSHEHGTIVYIVPETYFHEHEKLWEGEIIIRPPSEGRHSKNVLEEIAPGVFKSSYDEPTLKSMLCGAGCVESLLLRIYINEVQSNRRIEA